MRQVGTATDWSEVIDALTRGDPLAVLTVTRVITAFLIRARAYEARQAWDDLCQDVLLVLIANARDGRLRDSEAFVGYVGSITRHKVADWFRRNPRAVTSVNGQLPDRQAVMRDDDLLVDVEEALGELDERQRNVVNAIYVAGYSYQEAADRLGMPLGTLKRVQTGALRAIRARLMIEVRARQGRASRPAA